MPSRACRPCEKSPRLQIKRFQPHLGGLVNSVDLSQPIAPETRRRLQQALLEHGVLFFRDQHLSREGLVEVAKLFGQPYKQNESSSTLSKSVKATISYAKDPPPRAADAVWCSTAAAYDLLEPGLAAYLETLTAVNSFKTSRQEVPVIATHPETGRRAINVREGQTQLIQGMNRMAGDSLLILLFDLIRTPELQARLPWKWGSLAVWDNRQVQHFDAHDSSAELRRFQRLSIREAALS